MEDASSYSGSEQPPATRLRPFDWARAAGVDTIIEQAMDAAVRRRRRRRAVMTGGLTTLAAIFAFTFTWRAGAMRARAEGRSAHAFVLSPLQQRLPDGTVVELKGGATIAVDYSGEFRRVTLQRGEAHFAVAKNPARPFIVTAGGVEVRAVGTAFMVGLAERGVDVVVTEGRVAVQPAGPLGAASVAPKTSNTNASAATYSVFIDAGHRVSVESPSTVVAPAVVDVTPLEMQERISWRIPRLELNSTPLAEVLPVLNQHGGARLTLASPDLGEVRLSGVLRANNLPVLLQILHTSYGIEAEYRSDGEVRLYRNP